MWIKTKQNISKTFRYLFTSVLYISLFIQSYWQKYIHTCILFVSCLCLKMFIINILCMQSQYISFSHLRVIFPTSFQVQGWRKNQEIKWNEVLRMYVLSPTVLPLSKSTLNLWSLVLVLHGLFVGNGNHTYITIRWHDTIWCQL